MSSVSFSKIHFANSVTGQQHLTLEYKLGSQPSSSYALVDSDVVVETDGTIGSPPVVSGLTSGVLYNFKWSNNCDSPADYWVENITAP